jgi:hypothetical protein
MRLRAFYTAAADYKQSIVSLHPITQDYFSTALDIDKHEVGVPAPAQDASEKDNHWMGIDYNKSLSVAELKQHLTNAANSLPYEAKE